MRLSCSPRPTPPDSSTPHIELPGLVHKDFRAAVLQQSLDPGVHGGVAIETLLVVPAPVKRKLHRSHGSGSRVVVAVAVDGLPILNRQ